MIRVLVPEIFQTHKQFAAREEPVLVILAPPIRHRVTVAVVLFCHLCTWLRVEGYAQNRSKSHSMKVRGQAW
jgi:hypothetical protein